MMSKIVLFTFFLLISLQSFSEVLENEPAKNTMNPDSLLNESNANSESDNSSSQDRTDEVEILENQEDQIGDDAPSTEEDAEWDSL
jgi:hypothetical protein